MPDMNAPLRPGLISGDYPEQQDRLLPWPEVLVARLSRSFTKHRVARSAQLHRLLDQMERESSAVNNLNEAELTNRLAGLRQHMQVEGFLYKAVATATENFLGFSFEAVSA